MNRPIISMSIMLLLASLGIEPAFAARNTKNPTESLFQAVVDGDVSQVQSLIAKGADVDSKNRMNWTPLHAAVQNRRKEIVELLIAENADVDPKDGRGETPLHFAVKTGQKDIVEMLIAEGANMNTMSQSDNALSLARKGGHTEIVALLLEYGAKEPTLMLNEEGEGLYEGYEGQIQPGAGTFAQAPVQMDILADPNEIRTRIKTFEGLEKSLGEIAGKGEDELRQWRQKRYDNRTYLLRSVQKQFEGEIGFVRKVAVEEEAKKTTEAIDSLLSRRKERFRKVSKELLAQKRELQQTQSSGVRGRGRSSGRSTRGRSSQGGRGQAYGEGTTEQYGDGGYGGGYGGGGGGTSRMSARGRPGARPEPLDRETENEIRLWSQATIDRKEELAKGVHGQILAEIGSVRNVAVEEEAKKTTAAIDGLLLARQERLDGYIKEVEEEKLTQRQGQDPRSSRYGDPRLRSSQGGRQRGRTSRGGIR